MIHTVCQKAHVSAVLNQTAHFIIGTVVSPLRDAAAVDADDGPLAVATGVPFRFETVEAELTRG